MSIVIAYFADLNVTSVTLYNRLTKGKLRLLCTHLNSV